MPLPQEKAAGGRQKLLRNPFGNFFVVDNKGLCTKTHVPTKPKFDNNKKLLTFKTVRSMLSSTKDLPVAVSRSPLLPLTKTELCFSSSTAGPSSDLENCYNLQQPLKKAPAGID